MPKRRILFLFCQVLRKRTSQS